MSKNEIIEWVYTNKRIDDAIKYIVQNLYYDDFKSHFILQLFNTDEEKLKKLYNKNELIYFSVTIITNQWRSNTSSFWKIYRNNGFAGKKSPIIYADESNFNDVGDDLDEMMNIDIIDLKETVQTLLKNQYEDFLTNQYHKRLFEMYYFKNMNYRQIEEKTEIHFVTVRRSVVNTIKWLKKKLN